jgi:hypothetical protein
MEMNKQCGNNTGEANCVGADLSRPGVGWGKSCPLPWFSPPPPPLGAINRPLRSVLPHVFIKIIITHIMDCSQMN